ncbi:MAG: hypothetical protein FKY71_08665 [Spiribacter salinus]|uniref:Holin n=1 Tax=Spiribacter salinus TaxID=1335746 RepID=A0A540VTG1_9GAMM|nr:MAG: hypothetical protein FKY71_08665 [Spiribacter salinus]
MIEGTFRSWKYRRRAVFLTLAGCFGLLAYVVGWGEDNDLNGKIADGALNVIWLTVGIYVGGSTADDWLKDKERRA